jgi:hypothetical protein
LSGVARLVWTCVSSFVGSIGLGGGVFKVDWLVMCNFSGFSSFWAKLAVIDRVSNVAMVVDGVAESEEMMDDFGEEKTAKFAEILPVVASVVLISVFFPFLESAGDRDVATQVE